MFNILTKKKILYPADYNTPAVNLLWLFEIFPSLMRHSSSELLARHISADNELTCFAKTKHEHNVLS